MREHWTYIYDIYADIQMLTKLKFKQLELTRLEMYIA